MKTIDLGCWGTINLLKVLDYQLEQEKEELAPFKLDMRKIIKSADKALETFIQDLKRNGAYSETIKVAQEEIAKYKQRFAKYGYKICENKVEKNEGGQR